MKLEVFNDFFSQLDLFECLQDLSWWIFGTTQISTPVPTDTVENGQDSKTSTIPINEYYFYYILYIHQNYFYVNCIKVKFQNQQKNSSLNHKLQLNDGILTLYNVVIMIFTCS